MIIELHGIQTFAPSNLNRDDTGNPKDALFGGRRRARISSQSAKRAMRVSPAFEEALPTPTGKRTKLIIGEIVRRAINMGCEETFAQEQTESFAEKVFAKADSKDKRKTSVLVYISDDELGWISQQIVQAFQMGQQPDIATMKKEFEKAIKNRTSAPDVALFGRMLAENPSLNIDAACQVAHAISTHEVASTEFDYFTAVDDLLPNEDTGAAMLGLVAFNSATYYRNVRIDWGQLVSNLGGDVELARHTINAFMRAFALAVPTGMQNSFINKHAPDFLMAVVRPNHDGQSLANAFEKPVTAGKEGYAENSIKALATYWEQVEGCFRLQTPFVAVLNPRGYELPSQELAQGVQPNLVTWIDAVLHQLPHEEA